MEIGFTEPFSESVTISRSPRWCVVRTLQEEKMEEENKELGNSLLMLVHILIYIELILYNVMAAVIAVQVIQLSMILVLSLSTSYGLWYVLNKRIPEIYKREHVVVAYAATLISVALFLFVNMGLCAGLGPIIGM
jgi:hypothetical protein